MSWSDAERLTAYGPLVTLLRTLHRRLLRLERPSLFRCALRAYGRFAVREARLELAVDGYGVGRRRLCASATGRRAELTWSR